MLAASTTAVRFAAALAVALAVLASAAHAHPPKGINVTDPDVQAAVAWLGGSYDAARENATVGIVHVADAQRQLVNGYNYFFVLMTKEVEGETVAWALHRTRVYERPAWQATEGDDKYTASHDEVPVYDPIDCTDVPTDVMPWAASEMGVKRGAEMAATEAVTCYVQSAPVQYVTLADGTQTVPIDAYAIDARFRQAGSPPLSVAASLAVVVKDGTPAFLDYVIDGEEAASSGGGGAGGASELTARTANIAFVSIFLVLVTGVVIVIAQRVRQRRRRSKEEWYIEQLTDIDEL